MSKKKAAQPAQKKKSVKKIALIATAVAVVAAAPLVYALKSADDTRIRLVFPVFANQIEFPIPETWPRTPLVDAQSKGKYIIQFAPKGQTLNKWSEIITLEVFENQAKVPAAKLFNLIGANYKKVCKDAELKVLRNDNIDGKKALQGTLACPSNTSGKAVGDLKPKQGEFALFYIVQGDKDLYSFQYANRPGKSYKKGTRPVTDAKLLEMQKMFNKLKLCPRNEDRDACIKRDLKSKPKATI